MTYLFEDSKFMLTQLEAPFKVEGTMAAQYVKGESEEIDAKKGAKRRNLEPAIHGY